MISAFLLFHILAITAWCIPLETPLIAELKGFIRPYMFWSGLFQGWDMFAPSPRSVNAYVEAAVIFKDGRIHNWKFPRMEQLGLTERYYRERYRKFVENLQVDSNSALWPDAARMGFRKSAHAEVARQSRRAHRDGFRAQLVHLLRRR